ncbi:efflux RND transporter periplasmic adaptor subunit [Pseudoflavitalea sp. X16]|uniref:efflux RND transporter periplasmic adaptor subunit n=1 Tax=Paraflavitalea devenefica TaxID=2716334 RepID=UPI0014247A86|nr:efflux RND transporter periplasmic adaptor subunit [Paraflavitalea devenefica]NII24795.1 efflux RND transporter periplasmic adaptor subunit [Paraflavitalea devenefica]
MKTMYRLSALAMVLLLAACGATSGDKDLAKKKEQLKGLKAEQKELATKIDSLEAQIQRLDTTAVKEEKTKLVALTSLQPGSFTHYIDLKGSINTENSAFVMPRGQGGLVRAIYVKQGDNVRKGQLLMKLDDPLTQKQIEQAKINLALAQTTYERRKNLWDQKIGTEIELLTAKNNVENIQKQIDLLKEQQELSDVYAEMSGVAEVVNIKVGEVFAAVSAATMGIVIVNTNDLKVVAEVPENYLGRVGVGSNLLITLPELANDTIRTRVSVAGKIINPNSRAFYVEAKIPAGKRLRPNQLAMVRIQDYADPKAITIPIATIQSDEKGKFVMVASKEKDKLVARKKPVNIGESYGDRLEIKSGLQAGDQLITDGFQGLYDGQAITTEVK